MKSILNNPNEPDESVPTVQHAAEQGYVPKSEGELEVETASEVDAQVIPGELPGHPERADVQISAGVGEQRGHPELQLRDPKARSSGIYVTLGRSGTWLTCSTIWGRRRTRCT